MKRDTLPLCRLSDLFWSMDDRGQSPPAKAGSSTSAPPPPSRTATQSNRSVLTSILNSLSSLTPVSPNERPTDSSSPPAYQSPLHDLSRADTERARSLLLTLHTLFPHELLPALDLLDRGLVMRLQSRGDDVNEVYYVQSSSVVTATAPHGHPNRTQTAATFYEVRLDSWNCTCPAFCVSAFQGLDLLDDTTPKSSVGWHFGGVCNRSLRPPSCKHILAATLAKAAPNLFGDNTRHVTRDEMVGWGGGWGELGGGY